MYERYSIDVDDDYVYIWGDISIREAFDYLSFFDQQGFKSLCIGHENSTLRLCKDDCDKQIKEIKKEEAKEQDLMYKGLYERSQKQLDDFNLENLSLKKEILDIVKEKDIESKRWKDANDSLYKKIKLMELQNSPFVDKIFKENGIEKYKQDERNIFESFYEEEKAKKYALEKEILVIKNLQQDALITIAEMQKQEENLKESLNNAIRNNKDLRDENNYYLDEIGELQKQLEKKNPEIPF